MTVQRSERFDADLERQFRWYLLEVALDPVDALALASRLAEAVDEALEVLQRNPELGQRRFGTCPDLTLVAYPEAFPPLHHFLPD